MGTIGLVIIAGVLGLMYFWYARIITRRNSVKEALSGIDVQLKQRMNLIPNILTIAKKFMEHETELFSQITLLREKVNQPYDKGVPDEVKEHLAVSNELAGKMSQFKLSVENYPTLKSDSTMVQAMQTYNEVEAKIAAARRFYNAAVKELNNSVQIFPGSLIARMVNVSEMSYYEAEESAKATTNASDFL